MFIDVHTTMLKASQNKNVLSCRLKAAWDYVAVRSAKLANNHVDNNDVTMKLGMQTTAEVT